MHRPAACPVYHRAIRKRFYRRPCPIDPTMLFQRQLGLAEDKSPEICALFPDDFDQCFYVKDVLTQCPWCDLAMYDLGADVGIVWSDLPPAPRAVRCRNPNKRQKLPAERLDFLDLIAPRVTQPTTYSRNMITFRSTAPVLTSAIASLIPSSG